jgi:hypothetical protein
MEHICTKKDDIESIRLSVQRIEEALLGDKFHPDGGLINRLEKIEKKQRTTDRKIITYTALVSGFVSGAGFVLKLIFK